MNNLNLEMRKIEKRDMSDVIELLQSISEFKPSKSDFDTIWFEFHNQPNVHSVVALIDGVIVGYGSVVIETKIRGGKIGHIEDIVSHVKYRKKKIGKAVVDSLFEIAKSKGCYKVALQCKEHIVPFYNKCDYELSGSGMMRFL